MGGYGKDPSSTIGAALAHILEPLVQLERATVWADAQDMRFFSIDYFDAEREEGSWEATLYGDAEDAKRLGLIYPHAIQGSGDTLAAALKDALSKVYQEES